MAKYRKLPVVIEAEQFQGAKIKGVCDCLLFGAAGAEHRLTYRGLHVHTIHGGQPVFLEKGDWIIPEPNGVHFYPCKPDVFAQTYEAVHTDEGCTILPDGSAFGVLTLPLPADHWLYAEPNDLPAPIFAMPTREQVWAAAKFAVKGATMNGKITDFDPDALCMNMAYAMLGPCDGAVAAEATDGE